ncbi:hypothetical protein EDC04DRAFT_356050 [Pisolithus marmoratus]|nr:hypothetical protein EDC04DRAFT_356050 [Pisolithus marmoratus]
MTGHLIALRLTRAIHDAQQHLRLIQGYRKTTYSPVVDLDSSDGQEQAGGSETPALFFIYPVTTHARYPLTSTFCGEKHLVDINDCTTALVSAANDRQIPNVTEPDCHQDQSGLPRTVGYQLATSLMLPIWRWRKKTSGSPSIHPSMLHVFGTHQTSQAFPLPHTHIVAPLVYSSNASDALHSVGVLD